MCISIVESFFVFMFQVWPCLAVMGGLDRGLRVGGRCVHRNTGRMGIVLGLVRPSAALAKVQWDDGEASTRWVWPPGVVLVSDLTWQKLPEGWWNGVGMKMPARCNFLCWVEGGCSHTVLIGGAVQGKGWRCCPVLTGSQEVGITTHLWIVLKWSGTCS